MSRYQEKVLQFLSGKIEGFYLGGGTALSFYYFHHRESLDLDFFTNNFSRSAIKAVVEALSKKSGKKITLIAEQTKEKMVKIMVYSMTLTKKEFLKIDFVEDWLATIHPPRLVNGIAVLSLEDIYLRKIYALSGSSQTIDSVGRTITTGGRQEAKDFYDVYCLSTVFMPLYKFALTFCDAVRKEGLVRWFRTYDRMHIKTGLLELKIHKDIDYTLMESHFKKQIDTLIEKEVGL